MQSITLAAWGIATLSIAVTRSWARRLGTRSFMSRSALSPFTMHSPLFLSQMNMKPRDSVSTWACV